MSLLSLFSRFIYHSWERDYPIVIASYNTQTCDTDTQHYKSRNLREIKLCQEL